MNHKHAFGSFALVLLAGLWLAETATAAPVEQRCADLGAQCLCSEPLRYPAGASVLREGTDPPDSEGAGAKECAGGTALDAEPTGMTPVSVVDGGGGGVDFPAASNPPATVLKMTSVTNDGDNSWLIYGNLPSGVQNETVCSRTYQRFGADLQINRDPMRVKLHEITFGGVTMQHEIDIGGGGNLGINYDCPESGNLNFQAAGRSSWVRFESCYDVGTSNFATRFRATVIETGQTETVTCPAKSVSTPASFSNYQIGNLFLQTLRDDSLLGSRYVTHAIQTRGPRNTSFWPGPASELEGGSSPPPPPPPPPPGTPLGKPGTPTYQP